SLQGGINVVQAVPNHADHRVLGPFRDFRRFGKLTVFKMSQHFFKSIGIAFEALARPPNDALAHHGDRDDGGDQDGPHDPAALHEVINNDIGKHRLFFCASVSVVLAAALLATSQFFTSIHS